MSKENPNQLKKGNSGLIEDDTIDLRIFFIFLLKNKIFIGTFSIVFFILSYLFSLTLKRVWQGEFQIVLESENPTKLGSEKLAPIVGDLFNNQKRDLNTQIGILKSPSVLMPIFDFVSSKKYSESVGEKLIYSKWVKNLEVSLEEKTTILNVIYKDTDKDLIIPVLNKMSLTYQEYSGKKKRIRNENTKKYLLDQVKKYKSESSFSLKRAQEFATDQDLSFVGLSKIKSKSPFVNEMLLDSTLNVESTRVNAANELRRINSKLDDINKLGNDYQKIIYLAKSNPYASNDLNNLFEGLENIDRDIVEMKTKFTQNDKGLLKLVELKKATTELIINNLINSLEANKVELQSIIKAASRPKGVLLTYKELLRKAARDELTLIEIENQIRALELRDSMSPYPWDLITNPTLLREPVAPSRTKISIFGSIGGFFIGILCAYFLSKKSNKTKSE